MNDHRIPFADLINFARDVFEKLGCPVSDAAEAADALGWASLRGVDTHGFRNLVPYYADGIRNGEINPTPTFSIEHETDTSARLNGDSGLGLVSATAGIRMAMQKARDHGIGMVAIHNTHHLGPEGYYAHLAVDQQRSLGMLGVCMTGHFFGRGNEVGVAPVDGAQAMFSTNPLSFSAPCARNPDFILDMSTAVATVNRIEMLGQRGELIPSGWAKDDRGVPTNDPNAARILYPLGGETLTGGHKGIGLSMMVSILSGVLSGGWSRLTETEYDQPTMGHFLAAIRIDQFMPADQFTAAMDHFVESIQQSEATAPHQTIAYPGSKEHAIAKERSQAGIPVDRRLLAELRELAESLSIDDGALRQATGEN